MDLGFEFLLSNLKNGVLNEFQHQNLYIPLQGKYTMNPEKSTFDLAEKINQFFIFDNANSNDPRVLLLLGDTGSGKSMFAQQLFQELWKMRNDGDPIPVWIPLPELLNPFHGAVEEVLQKYEFSESQISEMKKRERFIFVVDGYDELHQFQNCYVTNKWNEWNAKVLITCRSQALFYQRDPDKYFVPFQGEKRLPTLLRRLYVAPFSPDQIRAYVEAYNRLSKNPAIKIEDFDKILGLKELITTPFLLHLTVASLPDILENIGVEEENPKITQAKLYDVYVERWFIRQIVKLRTTGQLKDSQQNTMRQFWDYCQQLAQQMHANEVTVIPYSQQKVGGRLFGKQEKKNKWEAFLNEQTEILRSACPLKRMGEHHFGFIHASLVDYFATRAMYEEIQEHEDVEVEGTSVENIDKEKMVPEAENRRGELKGGLHYRVFAREVNGIKNLANRIEMNDTFKRKMLRIVEKSKTSERYAIGAANAITAFVKAGITFNGVDLSGVKISGSDISGGYFDHVDFRGSNLKHVLLARVWLQHSNLQNCQFDGASFGEYPFYKHDEAIISMVYRPELNIIAGASCNKVIIWRTDSYDQKPIKVVKSFEKFEGIRCIAISKNGKNLYIGGGNWKGDNSIRVYDLTTDNSFELVGHNKEVDSVHISDDEEILISGGVDGSVYVWEISSQRPRVLQEEGARVKCVHLSVDKSTVASGDFDNTVKVWNMLTGELISILEGHTDQVFKVNLNANGTMLASCGFESSIRVWNVLNGSAIVLKGHRYGVQDVCMSDDGSTIVSGGDDGTVRIWDVAGRSAKIIQGHIFTVSCVYLSNDGKIVASSGGYDKTLKIWQVDEANALISNEYLNVVNSVDISLDGKFMVAGTKFNIVKVWDLEKNVKVLLDGHTSEVKSVKLTSDCNTVISGSDDNTVRVWDLDSKKFLVLQFHTSWVNSIDVNFDGNLILTGSEDTTIRIWNLKDGSSELFQGHKASVHCVRLSTDQKMFISGSSDKTVIVWYIDSRQSLVFRGHTNTVTCIDLSDDNTTIVSGSDDKTVRVWKTKSGVSTVLTGHDNGVTGVQLSKDGLTVISTSVDNTIRFWDVTNASAKVIIRLHIFVCSISLQDKIGIFCIGLSDGSTQIWERIDTSNTNWQLKWSSNFSNPVLILQDSDFRGSEGLSPMNNRLIEQRGAMVDTKAELVGIVGQRSGSPLHLPRQENDNYDEFSSSNEDTLNN